MIITKEKYKHFNIVYIAESKENINNLSIEDAFGLLRTTYSTTRGSMLVLNQAMQEFSDSLQEFLNLKEQKGIPYVQ